MRISKRTLRRMDNVSDFCDIDTENNVATLHLHFDSAEEIINKNQSTPVHPVISTETIERMSHNMCIIPGEFDVAYVITIDDYQGYNPNQLLHAYKTGLESRYYRIDKEDKSAQLAWLIIAIIGLAILFLMVAGKHYDWFGVASSIAAMFMVGVLEMFFQVFFQESFIFYFIRVNNFDLFKASFRRLHTLQCWDQNGEMLGCLDIKT